MEATSDDFFTGISPTTYGSDLQPNLLLVCGPGLSPLIDLSLDLFPPMSAFAVYAALEPFPELPSQYGGSGILTGFPLVASGRLYGFFFLLLSISFSHCTSVFCSALRPPSLKC